MTALIVGVPAAAHREALLRPTAGGGRVPTWVLTECDRHGARWRSPKAKVCCAAMGLGILAGRGMTTALILSHPTDPEAGAMGLARLAWVAGIRLLATPLPSGGWAVTNPDRGSQWYPGDLAGLDSAYDEGHACGIVYAHFGLLERVERVEVKP